MTRGRCQRCLRATEVFGGLVRLDEWTIGDPKAALRSLRLPRRHAGDQLRPVLPGVRASPDQVGMRRPKLRDYALAVTCPTCNAPPGESCGVGVMGQPDVHPKRITLAIRTYPR